MFLSLDGIDGAGKSTQMGLLCDWLARQGHDVIACRDPGSTPLGERLRSLLLERGATTIGPRAEMLLYMAARAQLVDEVIRPALARGQTVVSDRYLLANVVYQGHAGGLDPQELWNVGHVATGGLAADLTLVLDLDPRRATGRLSRPLDDLERRDEAFRERLRAGFLAEAARDPKRIVVIDAAHGIDEVHAAICDVVARVCGIGCERPHA